MIRRRLVNLALNLAVWAVDLLPKARFDRKRCRWPNLTDEPTPGREDPPPPRT